MTTAYDTDPNTQTIAAAWASTELGQPEPEVGYEDSASEPATTNDEEATAKRVMIVAGVACGVAAGGLLGVMLYYSGSPQHAVAPTRAPHHAVVVSSSTATPTPRPVVSDKPVTPTVVAPVPQYRPGPAAVATRPSPAQGDTVVIDIPKPDEPPLPEQPEDPQPPQPPLVVDDFELPQPPKPPVVVDDFTLPEPPEPDPLPVFLPDLSLAPSPKLNPQPEPPSLPDLDLQAPVKP
jgi:hypothetical protein